jgi:glycosyltransferase involved in cell wall biosynthesis
MTLGAAEAVTDGLRVALVQDLLVSYGGSEQVLFALHRMFPRAPIFTTIFDPSRLPARFANIPVRTSFLQNIPGLKRYYSAIVPLMPFVFERFDLSQFDLIISSSHAFSKAVIAPPGAIHICYCHTPLRYGWSHQDEYLDRLPAPRLFRPVARRLFEVLRRRDYVSSHRVDCYIANSKNVQRRIKKYYGRPSDVVYPPVDVERFRRGGQQAHSSEGPYLTVGRLFSYKRIQVAVEACTRLGFPLNVVGRGPELRRLRRCAGPTVRFLGELGDEELDAQYRQCRALIFTADEDFGLVPLEAMASGRPVLALGCGGATETVVPGVTGELYIDDGVDGLIAGLQHFRPSDYNPADCRARADEFSTPQFQAGVLRVIERELRRTRDGGVSYDI